jgi:hypothetical protein
LPPPPHETRAAAARTPSTPAPASLDARAITPRTVTGAG